MKRVVLEGKDFNRLIAATKSFIGKDDRRQIYKYIKVDVLRATGPLDNGLVTAAACDGYRLSVERARAVFVVDDDLVEQINLRFLFLHTRHRPLYEPAAPS